MELHLKLCTGLESVILLPDGEPPAADAGADAAGAAVVVPSSNLQRVWRDPRDAVEYARVKELRSCVPCSDKRVNMSVCDVPLFENSAAFVELCEDSRVHTVDVSEPYYGYHAGDSDDGSDYYDDDNITSDDIMYGCM